MKIAITADAHLRTGAEYPERYNALENVFEQTVAAGIENLIIAGDLFDKDFQNYSEFEALCRKHASLQLYIIPGNHDPSISKKSITGDNVHIYTEPTAREFDSVTFLFVPYEQGATMGEKIAHMEPEIDGKTWVLIGHGDFYGGVREPNPLEPGTYMPLSRNDLGRFKPRTVFLGHIHKAHSPIDHVTYVGSPCGLDISETGRRTFVVYDTADGSIDTRVIKTDVLYFKESFLILPRDNEVPLLEQEIASRIQAWGIDPPDYSHAQLRVEASGYAKDRSAVLMALEAGFEGFSFYKNERPSVEHLSVSSDDQLEAIAERTIALIEELDWTFDGDEPTREQIEVAALSVIYGN
jgi:DNA repair exonuclease SbcCD nuclease subunit